jgi:PAS domain S-box-containing protein
MVSKDQTTDRRSVKARRQRGSRRSADAKKAAADSGRVVEAPRASEGFYRALIENVSENITVVRADGTIAYVSPANVRIFGYKPGYLIGKQAIDFIHPDDATQVLELFMLAVQNPGSTQTGECRYRAMDGSWRYVEAVGRSFLDDPTVGGVVINSSDITERKRAEEALKRSEEYFRAIVEDASDGIAVLNADGSIRYRSPAVERLFGYAADTEIDSYILQYVHPEDQEKVKKAVTYIIENPGVTLSLESRFKAKDKPWGWIEVAVRSLLDDPIVGGIVINYRDITERKMAQDAIRESENRQHMAVMEERNRIAREIHDTLAQGFTGIVLQLEAAEEILDQDVSTARQYVDRARRLARESLAEARRSVYDLRPQALEKLTLEESLRQEVQKLCQDTEVKAEFDILGEKRPLSPVVETALLRICQESLANVKKHAHAKEVEANLVFEEDSVSLSVRDNGVGFDADARYEGSYGLIGMRERVRLLGGTLEVRSERGRGTLVEVTFPCK